MAKELPYFKFRIKNWLTGNVTLLDMQTQGVFINVCVLFWSRDCELNIDDLFERFKKKDKKCLEKLIEKKIICVENKNISIKFLEKQQESFEILGETNKKNVKKRYETEQNQPSNSTDEKQSVYNIDKIRGEEIREDKIRGDNINVRKLKFSETLKPFLDQYGKELLNNFYGYWTEPNKSNTKFRQELEKTWSLERRLETWDKNNFKNGKQQTNSNQRKTDLDGLSELTNRVLQQPFTLIDYNAGNSE